MRWLLSPLARLAQRRAIARCERYGGSAGGDGRCLYPEDHYPRWRVTWRLS